MARPNTTNSPAFSYGKLVYSPDEYSSSDDSVVNIAPKFLGNEASAPKYTTGILLPHALDQVQGTRKLELENACAIHSNIRNEYFFAYMLHQEALKSAQSYKKQANEAFAKLQDVSACVTACMATAFYDLEHSEQSGHEESLDSKKSSNEEAQNHNNQQSHSKLYREPDDHAFRAVINV